MDGNILLILPKENPKSEDMFYVRVDNTWYYKMTYGWNKSISKGPYAMLEFESQFQPLPPEVLAEFVLDKLQDQVYD